MTQDDVKAHIFTFVDESLTRFVVLGLVGVHAGALRCGGQVCRLVVAQAWQVLCMSVTGLWCGRKTSKGVSAETREHGMWDTSVFATATAPCTEIHYENTLYMHLTFTQNEHS